MLGEILLLAGRPIDRSKKKDETSVENLVYVFGLFCAFFKVLFSCPERAETYITSDCFFANGCSLRESRRKQN